MIAAQPKGVVKMKFAVHFHAQRISSSATNQRAPFLHVPLSSRPRLASMPSLTSRLTGFYR